MVVEGSARGRLRRAVVPALAVGAAIGAGGCGLGSAPVTAQQPVALVAPSSQRPASATPSTPAALAPLTGLPADPQVAGRAAVAVALSLARGTTPVGLDSADVVYEAWLDHGATRLLPVFQSHDPATAGPVAGTLPSDAQVLSVLHPVLADTGGSAGFVQALQASEVLDAPARTGGHGYTGSGPHLTAVVATLRQAASAATAPPPLFAYDDGTVTRNHSTAATSVTITAPGRSPEQWSFDRAAKRWKRGDDSGIAASVSNLVLQTVPYEAVLVHHPGTATVPVARPVGSGRAVVLTGAAAVAGSWTKPGPAAVTNFVDEAEVPVWFQPGTTWVALLSPGSRVSIR